jgi:hypothetical protein
MRSPKAVYEENSQAPSGILLHFVLAARTVHAASILLAIPRPFFVEVDVAIAAQLRAMARQTSCRRCCPSRGCVGGSRTIRVSMSGRKPQ